ncbi:hypothetical protein AQI88_08765 [Streptomyces cellostaticus]|uniref:SnoaL-like domain-containing protein n=1 Tax=Streptomyces cellostaticus TaxID=67285 RepID=A0A101NPJ3_9ACTN|nr:hypothetical protein [Streptomyces cellostaticus]KUM97090.1 hypothetical protein AQI88_08765 [Streptomyces cellostaticus]GHI03845.1 hypothetical protein Scel_21660 [Streptomyces cellostaticus]
MSVQSRKTLLTAAALTAGLTLAAVTPALAGTGASHATRAAAVSSTQGDPRNVTQRVADFYGAYIDSVWANEDPAAAANAKALRGFYLSAAAQKKVTAYEKKNHADGILFAQNVPVKWKVTYTGSGMGHATSRVTLTWSDGAGAEVSKIDVQSDLKTLKITDLKPAG